MVSETVKNSGTKTKVEAKKTELSCWNCFTAVVNENVPDTEPANLPTIRRENRQKYKLYSFLASQISRPKTIPLAQKVSENYKIGKTVEQKITAKSVQQNLINTENKTKQVEKSTNVESLVESKEDITKSIDSLVDPANFEDSIHDKEKKIQDNIKEYNLFEAYKSIRRKTPTPNSTLSRTKDDIRLDFSDVSSNATDTSIENNMSTNYKKLEIVQPKITIRKVYESPSISITSNTFITKSQEGLDRADSGLSRSSNLGKEKSPVLRRASTTNIISTKMPSITKAETMIPNLVFESSVPNSRGSSSSLNLNKPYSSNTSLNEANKSLTFVCKSLKIQELNKDKLQSTPILNMPLISPKTTPSNSMDNIIHKVQIETSTPKPQDKIGITNFMSQESSNVIKVSKNQDDLEKITEGIQNITLESKELTALDKNVDNASSNGSESGYSGSTTRDLPETDLINKSTRAESRNSVTSENEPESPQLSIPKPRFKSSLPVLVSKYKDLSTSTKSLVAGSNSELNKPVKKLRWSTQGLSREPTDDVYLSDSISPGHATLPRRSNSPLPHERDLLDRDRFSLNRSGLQARSESMASVYSGAGEGTRANVTVRGEVQFSLLYNYRLGALEVGVKRCRDLAPVDTKRNRSDPYVKVYLLPDKSKAGKRKTKVKKNTLNPVFEETLSFAAPLSALAARTLWLSAWHADMFGRNDFLGEVALPLADVVFDDPAPMWYKLHERTEQFDEQQGSRGDLIIGLKFELHETGALRGKGTLHVLVKEAKNLVATKPNGLADVFCKSYLLPERGRLAKQKTSVVRRSLNPRWEHTFTYRGLKMQELSTRALELSLWDRDRLASNDFMGAVRLSLGTGTYMGANVNWMDSVGKEVTLWQTMMQRPNFWVEGSLPLRPQLSN